MLSVIKESDRPTYSLFVPFTRLWSVDRFLQSLNAMYLLKASTEVIFYNDTDDAELQQQLAVWLDIFGYDFNGAKLYQSGNQTPIDNGRFSDIVDRRQRICAVKEKSKELISSDSTYVFGLEDDTIAPPNAFLRLLERLASDDEVAISSGIEMGRHAVAMMGAWSIRPLDDPQIVNTVQYRNWGTQEVDGVGWYCYMTYTSLYRQAHYRFEANCLGPDVMFALDQRRAGHKVVVDWTINCKHLLKNGDYLMPSENSQVVSYKKENGQWQSPTVSIYRRIQVNG